MSLKDVFYGSRFSGWDALQHLALISRGTLEKVFFNSELCAT